MFSGFFAIIKAIAGAYAVAGGAVLIALVFDGLDGRVARLINAETDFGAEYDSISDALAFGVAPAVLTYLWALQPFDKVGWLGAFMFAACGGLRLARFNTQEAAHSKRYFQGLPIPAAAATLASWVLLVEQTGLTGIWVNVATLVTIYLLAFLMVSNIRYRSFKDIDIRHRVPFPVAVLMVGGVILVATHPPLVLFFLFFIFVLAGPLDTISQVRRRHKERKQARMGKWQR